jgi:hypothetical protein
MKKPKTGRFAFDKNFAKTILKGLAFGNNDDTTLLTL